jgi:poly(A) polymerase
MIKKFIRNLQDKLSRKEPTPPSSTVQSSLQVIPKGQHHITEKHISDATLRVLQTLRKHNHAAYLVGGSVRDLLIGLHPKDFDVATDATPEELVNLFRSAMIIGRRFRIVHIRFGRETIEVTTFRGHHHDKAQEPLHHKDAQRNKSGMLLRDNVYGTVEEDALRRDFTVNALYYNIDDHALHDYLHGMEDIQRRQIRMIGNPEQRYREDPVRMLRAVRLAAKLDFSIEATTAAFIPALKHLLKDVPPARLFDEVLKLFTAGYAEATFALMQQYELFGVLFPQTAKILTHSEPDQQFITLAFRNTDERIRSDKRTSPAYLFATLLWPAFREQLASVLAQANPPPHFQAQHIAADTVIQQVTSRITLPRRFSAPMKEIWQLQFRLDNRAGSRAQKLFEHPRFRAAYDFVLLREESGEALNGLGLWWTDYQSADETGRLEMANSVDRPAAPPKRRRRRRKPHD